MVLKVAKSDSRKKPLTPQIEITNKGKINEYVNGIELTFDSYFTLFGNVEIIIGDKKILYGNDAEDFKQYRIFPVPVNSEILKPYESIKIFVWNPLSDDVVLLGANVDIDVVAKQSTLNGQAIDNDSLLSEISGGAGNEEDTHDIFPYDIYRDETKEFLINTKGRQNMLLTMASSNVFPPEAIPNSFSPDEPLDSYLLKLLKNPSTLPDSTSGATHEDYRDYVKRLDASCRGVSYNDYFRETKTVTNYLNDFEKILLQDNTELIDTILESFTDYHILIDGLNEINKQIKFDFNMGLLSGTISTELSYIKYETMRQIRTRSLVEHQVTFGTCNGRFYYSIGEWEEWYDENIWTSYVEKVIVTLRYELKYVVESSNTLDFAAVTQLDEITELSGTRTYSITDRYIRIRRVIVGTSLSYSVGDIIQSSNEEPEGGINYPVIETEFEVSNFIDLLSDGGEASLHFELQGVNEQWFTILDSELLGAVTQGQSKLIQFNIAGIPPSQSRFKAVLKITGSLKTGVTIDLVA